MGKEILYTKAKDKNGNLIDISDAQKGVDYYCPVCSKAFTFRKSGKTGKYSKRPHFAHPPKVSSPDCTPENVLHSLFQKQLIDLLEKYKSGKKPFIFNWNCASCGHKNLGNLLEKVALIKKEYVLPECRPDIALLDEKENVLAVIEIVVTHKPEDKVLQFYKTNKMTLIQINLTSDEDLKQIEEKAKYPDIVDFCLDPKCPNYDKDKINRTIKWRMGQCGRCYVHLPRFEIEINSIFGRQSSLNFTEDELNEVRSWVKLKDHDVIRKIDSDTKGEYPLVVCESCKRMRSGRNRRRF